MWYPEWLKRYRDRLETPKEWSGTLTAVYWEGTPECSHPVKEITIDGAQIITATIWPEGTMILVNLRYRPAGDGEERSFTNLWSVVTRVEPVGIRIEFMFSSPSEHREFRRFLRSLDGPSEKAQSSEKYNERTDVRVEIDDRLGDT